MPGSVVVLSAGAVFAVLLLGVVAAGFDLLQAGVPSIAPANTTVFQMVEVAFIPTSVTRSLVRLLLNHRPHAAHELGNDCFRHLRPLAHHALEARAGHAQSARPLERTHTGRPRRTVEH